MGIRDEIQADLAEAFDEDLADAVVPFSGAYLGPSVWDPVNETTTAQPVTYTGRGVLDSYDSRRVDNINIKVGDVLLICLANEVTDRPAVGHQITVDDLLTGQQVTYRIVSPGIDPAKAHYEIQMRK
ncbi:glutamate 5-kinase [Pseudomonas asiatica]|uniref:glutamate 5-kinase n=1 Tax=Pseudomonas asiatica TaxID=2219225 RepID=UPI0025A0C63A|nr:glutamate 5-kinase [Pseudomonas asiatica]MDM9589573.1 glutamate 5-kinase [Pseudomonas asiatica]WJM51683.1 glutamate 5-kinase [Pseudomonas asiatica]